MFQKKGDASLCQHHIKKRLLLLLQLLSVRHLLLLHLFVNYVAGSKLVIDIIK